MSDRTLDAISYVLMGTLCAMIFLGFLGVWGTLFPQQSNDNHAQRLCQQIYGPQTGEYWKDDQLMCQTVRGELVPIVKPQKNPAEAG